MTISVCSTVLPKTSKRPGEVCGRPVTGYLLHGVGRCAYHLSERERVRLLAARRAVRDLRELRALEPAGGECQDQPEARCEGGAVDGAELDVERFAGPALDE